MTEGSPDPVLTDDELDALLERPSTELSIDELIAINAALKARGIRIYNALPTGDVLLVAAAGSYATAFIQTLAKHNAEALIEAVRTRFRRKGKTLELVVGTGEDAAAFVVTASTPDEAKLAMLDVDVTTEELRGKMLRWDSSAGAWRPGKAEE